MGSPYHSYLLDGLEMGMFSSSSTPQGMRSHVRSVTTDPPQKSTVQTTMMSVVVRIIWREYVNVFRIESAKAMAPLVWSKVRICC